MKVKLLVGRAGADFSNSPGEVIDVDAAEGQRLCESGQAEAVAASTRGKKGTKERAVRAPKKETR